MGRSTVREGRSTGREGSGSQYSEGRLQCREER